MKGILEMYTFLLQSIIRIKEDEGISGKTALFHVLELIKPVSY